MRPPFYQNPSCLICIFIKVNLTVVFISSVLKQEAVMEGEQRETEQPQ